MSHCAHRYVVMLVHALEAPDPGDGPAAGRKGSSGDAGSQVKLTKILR